MNIITGDGVVGLWVVQPGIPIRGVERMTGHHCLRMREIILKNNRKWILVGSQLSRII